MSLTLRLILAVAAVALAGSACSDAEPTTTADTDQTSSTTVGADETSSTEGSTTSSEPTTAQSTTAQSTTAQSTTTADPGTTSSTATDEVVCSASGVERPGPQPDLPAPVAERREAILTAALACDIDRLAALTGPSFTASFGGGAPAEVWTADEEFGSEPMRALVEILRLPATAGDDGTGGVAYRWPPAFAYDTWDEVPAADRDALRVLYDDADFEAFAQFGGYIGYRTSITEDGTWTAFVAGD